MLFFLPYNGPEKGGAFWGPVAFEADVKRKRLRLKPQKSVRSLAMKRPAHVAPMLALHVSFAAPTPA